MYLPELARKIRTVITPNTRLDSSQKQNDTIHKAGINDVKELNNFLEFVNVIIFDRIRRSVIIPNKKTNSVFLFTLNYFLLPDNKLLNNVKKNPNDNM
jgi:hypothetical protein